MTTTNEDIAHALNKHFSTFTSSIRKVRENESYEPRLGTPYLQAWHVPGMTDTITLGPNGVHWYMGIFHINCFYPQAFGENDAKVMAGRLVSHFFRGTRITYNDILVKVRQAWMHPGFQRDAWYIVPVSVNYWCFDNST